MAICVFSLHPPKTKRTCRASRRGWRRRAVPSFRLFRRLIVRNWAETTLSTFGATILQTSAASDREPRPRGTPKVHATDQIGWCSRWRLNSFFARLRFLGGTRGERAAEVA